MERFLCLSECWIDLRETGRDPTEAHSYQSCYQPMAIQRVTLTEKMVAVSFSMTNGCRHKISFLLHSALGSEDKKRKGMKAIIMNLSVHVCPPLRGLEEQSEECKPRSVFWKVFGPAGCRLKSLCLWGWLPLPAVNCCFQVKIPEQTYNHLTAKCKRDFLESPLTVSFV